MRRVIFNKSNKQTNKNMPHLISCPTYISTITSQGHGYTWTATTIKIPYVEVQGVMLPWKRLKCNPNHKSGDTAKVNWAWAQRCMYESIGAEMRQAHGKDPPKPFTTSLSLLTQNHSLLNVHYGTWIVVAFHIYIAVPDSSFLWKLSSQTWIKTHVESSWSPPGVLVEST